MCMPHGPAVTFGLTLCAEYMSCICDRDNLHIGKTQRPVVVTATETTSLLPIGNKYIQTQANELALRLYCAIELLLCCIAEVGFFFVGLLLAAATRSLARRLLPTT